MRGNLSRQLKNRVPALETKLGLVADKNNSPYNSQVFNAIRVESLDGVIPIDIVRRQL